MKQKDFGVKLFFTVLLLIIGIVMVFPFLWMISSSFKPQSEINVYPIQWITESMSLRNYQKVFSLENPPFYVYYLNSIKISTIVVIGEVLTSAMAGYAFARLNFKYKNALFLLYIMTLMIPFQVLMVPQFMLFKNFGILNTHKALILPKLSTAFGTFMLRQYFFGIPYELTEAARIDGASEARGFFQIIMPLAKPAMATLGILTFVWRWNEYETPMVFINSKELFTLPLGLTSFVDETGSRQETLILAAAVTSLIPMLLVFMMGQKYLIAGIASGSVKG